MTYITPPVSRVGADRLPGWASVGTGVLAALFVVASLYPAACDDGSGRCTSWVGVMMPTEDTTLPLILAVTLGIGLWGLLRSVPRRIGIVAVAGVVTIAMLVVWLVWFPQPISGQQLVDKCASVGKVPHIDGGGGCMYPPGTELP